MEQSFLRVGISVAASTRNRHDQQSGTPSSDNKKFLKFATADGFLQVLDLQLEGKKRMLVEDFLRGHKI